MRPILLAAVAAFAIGASVPAFAADPRLTVQPGSQAGTQTVEPPASDPHAYTPAPMSDAGSRSVAPENRAGNATDAGVVNGTPLSGSQAPVIGTGKASRDQRSSDPTADPILKPR